MFDRFRSRKFIHKRSRDKPCPDEMLTETEPGNREKKKRTKQKIKMKQHEVDLLNGFGISLS